MAAFSFQLALAETEIPENLAPLVAELNCQTKEECAKAFDSNFEKGIELAEKYQVYSKEQSDMAQSYKQEVISKLSGLSEENFEEEIVKIAKELLKKPKLAKSFQLDKDAVSAAETIVAEMKTREWMWTFAASPQRRSLGNNLSDVWKRAKNWRKNQRSEVYTQGGD